MTRSIAAPLMYASLNLDKLVKDEEEVNMGVKDDHEKAKCQITLRSEDSFDSDEHSGD